MKKVFLLFGIVIFSSASAQQKDLFDIQKHLHKKQEESKKFVEKMKLVTPLKISTGQLQQQLAYTLPNGNKVIILTLDNMPCIVPDMKQFNMPNISDKYLRTLTQRRNMPGQIPNPISPYSLIPKSK